MKKKARNLPSNPFYTDEPAVAKNKMADSMLVPPPLYNRPTGKVSDRNPGKLSGIAGFAKKTKLPTKKPAASGMKTPGSSLRLSGHSGAHRIGAPKLPKMP